MRLIAISPENMNLALKDVSKYIEAALRYSDDKYNLDDVKAQIQQGLLTLWVVYNEMKKKAVGCYLTEILAYPRFNALCIFLLGGDDFDEILQTFEELKEYAKGMRCKTIEFYGRDGWAKILPQHGFVKTHILMRMNL